MIFVACCAFSYIIGDRAAAGLYYVCNAGITAVDDDRPGCNRFRTIIRDVKDAVVVIVWVAGVPNSILVIVGLIGIWGKWAVVGIIENAVVVIVRITGISHSILVIISL